MLSHRFVIFINLLSLVFAKDFCQPDNPSCWPTSEEIENFKNSLTQPNSECLENFPTFTSKDDPGHVIYNSWYEDMPVLLSPYELLNLRNFLIDNRAYFVILARSIEDVSQAVRFASSHDLALSIYSTGHEFQDRNSAIAPNGLLIRTTCLRTVNLDLEPDNRFDHPDGVVRLGSGMTWGTSKYDFKGVHEIAKENGRVVVSGHAAEVGIIGWSMGGGHSPLGPIYGLGVDQMLEVELVGPDGSYIIANANGTSVRSSDSTKVEYTDDASLFWAMRGGGAGPWGAVTAMTIKLHKPRNNCKEKCYHINNGGWLSNFLEDDGEMARVLISEFLKWVSGVSDYWSGYFQLIPGENFDYIVAFAEFMYTGNEEDEDAYSLENHFKDIYPDKFGGIDRISYDTYFDKTQNQVPETVTAGESAIGSTWTSVLLNRTILENPEEFAASCVKMWLPRCYSTGPPYTTPCTLGYMMHLTLPRHDDNITGTSVAKKFREANIHITTSASFNFEQNLSPEDNVAFVHEILSPELYKYGTGSYYSESEYSMEKGQWQNRLWDQETYSKLLEVKQTWDPEHLFHCRHCIGDEEQPINVNEKTMPSWRHFDFNEIN